MAAEVVHTSCAEIAVVLNLPTIRAHLNKGAINPVHHHVSTNGGDFDMPVAYVGENDCAIQGAHVNMIVGAIHDFHCAVRSLDSHITVQSFRADGSAARVNRDARIRRNQDFIFDYAAGFISPGQKMRYQANPVTAAALIEFHLVGMENRCYHHLMRSARLHHDWTVLVADRNHGMLADLEVQVLADHAGCKGHPAKHEHHRGSSSDPTCTHGSSPHPDYCSSLLRSTARSYSICF